MHMNKKSTFDRKFISRSRRPVFDGGYFEFIWALVSWPVYKQRPQTCPDDANTVFAHIVYSKVSFSSCSDSLPSSAENFPLKL